MFFNRLKYNFVFCIVTVKCCVSLQSDCAVLLLCCACLLDYLFSFSLFSVLTVCSGPALGNTRSYKLLDWNSVTAGIFPPFYCSHPKEWWQLSEVQPLNNNDFTLSQCRPARLRPQIWHSLANVSQIQWAAILLSLICVGVCWAEFSMRCVPTHPTPSSLARPRSRLVHSAAPPSCSSSPMLSQCCFNASWVTIMVKPV